MEVYDQYLTGDIYYVEVFDVKGLDVSIHQRSSGVSIYIEDPEGEELDLEDLADVDSCGGLYGLDYAFEEMLQEGGENE